MHCFATGSPSAKVTVGGACAFAITATRTDSSAKSSPQQAQTCLAPWMQSFTYTLHYWLCTSSQAVSVQYGGQHWSEKLHSERPTAVHLL